MENAMMTMSAGVVSGSGGHVHPGAALHLTGGTIGWGLKINGMANITAGTIGPAAEVRGTANIRGGKIGPEFKAHAGGKVHLFGTSFLIDGAPIPGLDLGETQTITERDVILSGLFEDDSAFSFELFSVNNIAKGHFHPDSILTVTLVRPRGDFDGDGQVDGDDLLAWHNAFGASAEGDADGDGDSDGQDFLAWQGNLGRGVAPAPGAVPEPCSAWLILAALACLLSGRRITCGAVVRIPRQ
jgi:hypothetical protein